MELRIIRNITIGSLMILILTSCYYDVEEELYPTLECESLDMSYANDIVPLISENCYVCHATNIAFGNVILDSYSNILVQVDNGRLVGAINRMPGFAPMPQSANKLLDCNIEKIESWINAGAPNN